MLGTEFWEWVHVRIDEYVLHCKNHVKRHVTPLHGFHLLELLSQPIQIAFFCLYLQNKSSESKVKLRQATNRCKMVLQGAKITYANKTKESITFLKLGFRDFWQIANSVLNKGDCAIFLNGPGVSASALAKIAC